MVSVELLELITHKTVLRSRKMKGNYAVNKVWFCLSLWVGMFSRCHFAWLKFSDLRSAAGKAHTYPWRVVPFPKWTPGKGGTGAKLKSSNKELLVPSTDHISDRDALQLRTNMHWTMVLAASLLKCTNCRKRFHVSWSGPPLHSSLVALWMQTDGFLVWKHKA